jgi:hypothetical protein
MIYFLVCPVTVEDTVYGNIWHMHVTATPSILNEKVLEKTVPLIVASGPGDPFASKFDLISCETDSNCQKCETPAEQITVFLLLLVTRYTPSHSTRFCLSEVAASFSVMSSYVAVSSGLPMMNSVEGDKDESGRC